MSRAEFTANSSARESAWVGGHGSNGEPALLRVRFADVTILPTVRVESVGPVSDELVARGVDTFRDAAVWLRSAPYGRNAAGDALAVFRDGCGTCTTKHAAIVTLADELAVELQLVWGMYALDESIIEGAQAVLDRAGVPFVPNIHCFVAHAGHYVDLTEGNCTGKRRQIEDYLAISSANVGDSEHVALQAAADELCSSDPRFAHMTVPGLLDTLDACLAVNAMQCPFQP